MLAAVRTGMSFVGLLLCVLLAVWFWDNYYRIGPESAEGFVFIGGWGLILVGVGVLFVQLIAGMRGMLTVRQEGSGGVQVDAAERKG